MATRVASDWHLSFYYDPEKHVDDLFKTAWGAKIANHTFVTAVGYYVSETRIQTCHALIQLNRGVTRNELEAFIGNRVGSYFLYPMRAPPRFVDRLQQSHGTFATFSVKEMYA